MNGKPVILFDGVCNLCNKAVQFVIKHDKDARFLFASLQSNAGQQLLKEFNISTNNFKSFVLIQNDKAYIQSTAALKVAKQISDGWKFLYAFIIVPISIRDFIYRIISNNRYKWFGKTTLCMTPSPELQSRFLV